MVTDVGNLCKIITCVGKFIKNEGRVFAAGAVAGNPDPVHSAEPAEPAEHQQPVVDDGVQAQLPAPRIGGRSGHRRPDATVRLVSGGQHDRRRWQPDDVPVVLGRYKRRHDVGHGQRVDGHVTLAQRASNRCRRRVPLPLAHQSHIAANQ